MAHIQDRRYRVDADGTRHRTGYTGDKPYRVRYRGPDGKERSKESSLGFTAPTMEAHPAPDATLLPQLTLTFHHTGPHRLEIRKEGDLLLSLPLMVH